MKLAALCCTYLRPDGLGQLIECFNRQDYPLELRELVILDDAGQYENQSGDGWRLVSIPSRFRSLGEKRNACAALASPDVEGFLVADDDDIYLPHWFYVAGRSVKSKPTGRAPAWSCWSTETGFAKVKRVVSTTAAGRFAKRRSIVCVATVPTIMARTRNWPAGSMKSGAKCCDPCCFAKPFYVYRYDNNSYHLSYMDDQGYRRTWQRRKTNAANHNPDRMDAGLGSLASHSPICIWAACQSENRRWQNASRADRAR